MIVEGAGGGWGDDAQNVWRALARAVAVNTGQNTATTSADLYQSLSLILHREGARAVLRRLCGTDTPASTVLASAHTALAAAPGVSDFDTT